MFVDLVNAVLAMNAVLRWRVLGVVLAMKAVRTMERGAQVPQMLAMVMLAALLPAPNPRRLRAAAHPLARTFRRRCRTCRWHRAFLSDEGDDRTCPLHTENTRRLASARRVGGLRWLVALRSTRFLVFPRATARETEPSRDWESAGESRTARMLPFRCDSRGLRRRSRSAQRLRLCRGRSRR